MQQDPDQAEKEDDKALTGRMFNLDFNFLSDFENGTDTLRNEPKFAVEQLTEQFQKCRNRETNVDPLPCCKQRGEEQKCWRVASNNVRIATDVLQDTETESTESVSQEEEIEQ